jgi:predicted short-subunit dehydrogenase-like oxidoreductase (DUF2520 family)
MKPQRKREVRIIGYGRVGSHLDYALRDSTRFTVVKGGGDVIFITTQDSRIGEIVRVLRSEYVKGKVILHTSGVLTSDVLEPLQKEGAETGSFHPVQTFAHKAISKVDVKPLKGIYVAVEGTNRAVKVGSRIAREIGARTLIIRKEDKVLHHICCVIASNYLVSMLSQIESLGGKIRINGFNERSFFSIYAPLIKQTIANVAKKGALKSLSGPIERGDIETVKTHLEDLAAKAPELSEIYKAMGRETAKLAAKKESLGEEGYQKFTKIFG